MRGFHKMCVGGDFGGGWVQECKYCCRHQQVLPASSLFACRKLIANWMAESKTGGRGSVQHQGGMASAGAATVATASGRPLIGQRQQQRQASAAEAAAKAAGGADGEEKITDEPSDPASKDDAADAEGAAAANPSFPRRTAAAAHRTASRPSATAHDYHSSRDVLQQQMQYGGASASGGAASGEAPELPPKAAPSTQPLDWVPLVDVGAGEVAGLQAPCMCRGAAGHRGVLTAIYVSPGSFCF